MFNLLMQLGMAIDSYSTTQNLYIGRGLNIYLVSCPHPFRKGSGHEANIYHRYGNRGPHIYVVLGTGSPILYSYGDPIHVGRGPQIYEGVPISTVDMDGGPTSTYIWGRGPRFYKVLGTWGPPYSHDNGLDSFLANRSCN